MSIFSTSPFRYSFPLLSNLLHWATPRQQCLWCQEPCDQLLCCYCKGLIQCSRNRCETCALTLADEESSQQCGQCLQTRRPFQKTVVVGDYGAPLDRWVLHFKHRRQLHYGTALSHMLLTQIQNHYENLPLPQYLVPVPLHWSRHLKRGFNQSNWIARNLQQALKIPVIQALHRQRTPSQQQLSSRTARQRNLLGSFVPDSSLSGCLEGSHVALIDDVMTTGSTASQAAWRLLELGAERVDIWCLARTPIR